jgi:predicted dehydrogenase
MLVYDDLEQIEKLKIYDAGVDFPSSPEDIRQILVSYRTGDMTSPRLKDLEALAHEVTHFAQCVRSGERSRTDGALGASLVRVLEAADESLRRGGAPIAIPKVGSET